MSKPKTRLAIILDKSGSMAGTKQQAIEGLNEQIQQAKIRAQDHDLKCSLVTFNGEVFEHLWDVPAENLVEAKPEDYSPIGGTAMRDAVGYTIQKLLSTAGPDDKETAYLVYVISDGDTNSDMHYNKDAIRELTEGCQATGRWTFTYMGHDPKYMERLARDTGVPVSNMAVWSNRTRGATKGAFNHQKQRLNKFFDERKEGKLQAADYASDQVGCLADFTDDQPADIATSASQAAETMPAAPMDVESAMGNLQKLLENQPKYQNLYSDASYDGTSLFGQTVGVKWTHEAEELAEGPKVVNTCSVGASWLNKTPRRRG